MTLRTWLLQTSAVRVSGTERIVPRLDTAFLGSSTRMGLYMRIPQTQTENGWIELIAFLDYHGAMAPSRQMREANLRIRTEVWVDSKVRLIPTEECTRNVIVKAPLTSPSSTFRRTRSFENGYFVLGTPSEQYFISFRGRPKEGSSQVPEKLEHCE